MRTKISLLTAAALCLVAGLLHGDAYRNYQASPTVWHWKKVKGEKPAPAKDEPDKADASNKPVGRLAEEKKALSAETILEKKVEGKATVEFLVGEVHTLNIDALFVPDVSHAQIIKAKVSKEGHEFWVIVSREIATRLLRLGVVDPAEHFRGKLMRVSGTVERVAPPSLPSTTVYKLHVTSLDQLESIRKP